MHRIALPWGKWTAERSLELRLPETWAVDVLAPSLPQPMDEEQLEEAIADALQYVPEASQKICLVVEDPARPSRLDEFLPRLVTRLRKHAANCSLTMLVASGCHSWENEGLLKLKYGRAVGAVDEFVVHDADGSVGDTGLTLGQVPVKLNRRFLDADCRILVGSTIPHPFAAFSGGAKNVLPGIADRQCTEYTHKMVRLGGNLGPDPDRNRFRERIEGVVRQLPVELCFCLLPDAHGHICFIAAGDVIEAHRGASAKAQACYHVPANRQYDAVILNAYPKDMDLVQSRAALAALPRKADTILGRPGACVLVTASPFGSRGHGLFSPGGSLYSPPRREPLLEGRHGFVLTGAPADEVHRVLGDAWAVVNSPESLVDRLNALLPSAAKVAVLPFAPITRLVTPAAMGHPQAPSREAASGP